MMESKKIRVGILFGGFSREREISFAGGRTVYDNLDKELFEPIPFFLDSLGNLILLNWPFLYKGTIRDFYPPAEYLIHPEVKVQVYAESLYDRPSEAAAMAQSVGTLINWEHLKEQVDLVFLCLHGPFGEDGRIQGLLEHYNIPYTGSGILASCIGINKLVQKEFMQAHGMPVPGWLSFTRQDWVDKKTDSFFKSCIAQLGKNLVVKAATQGSSIGVTVLHNAELDTFSNAIEKAFFIHRLSLKDWHTCKEEERFARLNALADIRSGTGFPLFAHAGSQTIRCSHPRQLLDFIEANSERDELILEGENTEQQLIVEQFIPGKEFSCIVIEDDAGMPHALPPTEIRKSGGMFDYRSKYLPGLARKVTPIELPDEEIQKIASACEKLFSLMHADVYARIDGFYTADGTILLNDPNTTSGMLPSSFFFHQAAEIGWNPSEFLTYIVHASLRKRKQQQSQIGTIERSQNLLIELLNKRKQAPSEKKRVAVILGGYSSERHISVESGRNIYEKLSSSSKYEPFPVFLTGDANQFRFYELPVHLLLKDNADDIRDKLLHFARHPFVDKLRMQTESLRDRFVAVQRTAVPVELTLEDLSRRADAVFIALHGRPGEDGALQSLLGSAGIPYNGSGVESSRLTINKFDTNERLAAAGFLVAPHLLVGKEEYLRNPEQCMLQVQQDFPFPFIAKPVDDGCSSAVKKINSKSELEAFLQILFRNQEEVPATAAAILKISPSEEMPRKNQVLIETLIRRENAVHFLEITGGLMTRIENNSVGYLPFEASEALATGEVLSLEEKFLAGEGQNITPARYHSDPAKRQVISNHVKQQLADAAALLGVEGYARIDAFVRVFNDKDPEVIFIEVNSLPGMTPATCIFHQAAIEGMRPYDFIDRILTFAMQKKAATTTTLFQKA